MNAIEPVSTTVNQVTIKSIVLWFKVRLAYYFAMPRVRFVDIMESLLSLTLINTVISVSRVILDD
jgi:hypothetical protein